MTLKKDHIFKSIIVFAFILNASSIIIYNIDTDFRYRWLSLFLWIGGVIFPIIYLGFRPKTYLKNKTSKYKFNFLLILIVALSIILRFYHIEQIPLLNGDEARDAGFIPQSFLAGKIKNFFGYGIYGIPNTFFILSSIPHLLFKHTVLSIRFFAALFGTLSVIMTYFLAKKMFNKHLALGSSALLSAYHVHLHFSRSEFINNFDSFWSSLIILLLWLSIRKNVKKSFYLGLFIGLASHFYQGIRAILLFSTLYFIIHLCFQFKKRSLDQIIPYFAYYAFGLFIGLGPSLISLILNPNEFFNTGTASNLILNNVKEYGLALGTINFVKILPPQLLHSFGSLVYYPLDFHYKYGGPLVQFPFSVFLLFGFLTLFKNIKKPAYNILLMAVITIIFFNSTILDNINFAHRLLSLTPLIMIILALGIEKSLLLITKRKKLIRLFLGIIVSIFILSNYWQYFIKSVWKNAYDTNTRVAAIAGQYTATLPEQTKIFFLNSPRMGWKSGPNWEYLSPNITIKDVPKNTQSLISQLNEKPTRFVVIALPERINELEVIKNQFPHGTWQKHDYDNQWLFSSYQLIE